MTSGLQLQCHLVEEHDPWAGRGRVAQPFGFRSHRSGLADFPHPALPRVAPVISVRVRPSSGDARSCQGSMPSGPRTPTSPSRRLFYLHLSNPVNPTHFPVESAARYVCAACRSFLGRSPTVADPSHKYTQSLQLQIVKDATSLLMSGTAEQAGADFAPIGSKQHEEETENGKKRAHPDRRSQG